MLNRQFNVAVLHIASRLFPRGFDVADNAPATLADIIAHHNATGRVCVWSGGSEGTIYSDAEVNYAFRAWHDWHHITKALPFTRHGEFKACQGQALDVMRLYGDTSRFAYQAGDILRAEILGQFDYKARNGAFPVNQEAFVRAYLTSPEAALRGAFH